MMNWVWGGMMVLSVVAGLVNGRMKQVSDAVLNGGTKAIELCFAMAGMMMFWSGLSAIMQFSGLSERLGRLTSPVIRFIFPDLKEHPKARNAIALNMAANLLGLGNAATPLGLKAMKELNEINRNSHRASNSMITFVVLNSVSIQLIPTSLSVLRTQYGSENPMDILIPVWFVSVLGTIFAVGFVLLLNRRRSCYG